MDRKINRLLIVAPLSVVPVWPKEFEQYADFAANVTVLEGSKEKKLTLLKAHQDAYPSALEVLAVNYESTWRLEDELCRWKPDMIIADESQRIKAPRSNQSRAMHHLGACADYKLILTGTPVTNSPIDFWSQYQFLQPGVFDRSFYAFKGRYVMEGGYGGHEIIGYKNLKELTKKAHSIAHRVTKAQALDLPEATSQNLYCDLEPAAAKVYKQMAKNMVAELEGEKKVTAAEVIVRLLRLAQIAGGFVQPDGASKPESISTAKLSTLEEVVADLLDNGKKVVIFARFREEIKAIRELAAKLTGDEGYRLIWGDTPQEDRGTFVEDFQSDPEVKIFIAQIQTAGLGITLTAADTAIFYSFDYSYANYEQAKARIHRIGQKNTCTYLHLIARGTVDETIMDALAFKKNLADELVDNWRSAFK